MPARSKLCSNNNTPRNESLEPSERSLYLIQRKAVNQDARHRGETMGVARGGHARAIELIFFDFSPNATKLNWHARCEIKEALAPFILRSSTCANISPT